VKDRLYFQPDIETLPLEKLKEMQLTRFRREVERAMDHNDFYRELYTKAGVEPAEIRSIEDVRRVPCLDRDQVQELAPMALLCVETSRLREIHTSSGRRNGKPFLVAATQQDIDYWADLNARSLWMVGLRPGDILLNAHPMGLTARGFGFHYGALKLGMTSIPAGQLAMERLVDLLLETGAKGLCGPSSLGLGLAKSFERRKEQSKEKCSCRVVLLGFDPWSRSTRERIEEALGVKAFDHYGMSEFLGPGMGCECEVRDRRFGMHAWSDAFLCECIDPRTEEPVADEEEGELIWTALVWQGTPLIRYKSRDLSAITWRPCECGRTHPRLAAIKGRTDDAVALEGIILYPSQVEESLSAFDEAGSQFRIVVDRDRRGGDYFEVRVELKDKSYLQEENFCQTLARKMREAVRQATGLTPRDVGLEPPGGLKKTVGSQEKTAAVRVEDKRRKA
jgi:phenylacetate-CoA ligase